MLVYNTLFSRILQEGNAYFLENFYRGLNPALSCIGGAGHTNCRRRVRPDGAAPFPAPAERGARTASACSPFPGGAFSAPAERGTRTALACSPLTGGEFFAEPQRGDSPSADGGSVAAPTAGAKRKDNLRFSFLFELLPFPCFLIWRRFPICDRFEKGNGSRVTAACLSPPFRSSQTAYCYTCGLINAECGITVPHNSSARYDRQHLRR